jgi:hypothetical protein
MTQTTTVRAADIPPPATRSLSRRGKGTGPLTKELPR